MFSSISGHHWSFRELDRYIDGDAIMKISSSSKGIFRECCVSSMDDEAAFNWIFLC